MGAHRLRDVIFSVAMKTIASIAMWATAGFSGGLSIEHLTNEMQPLKSQGDLPGYTHIIDVPLPDVEDTSLERREREDEFDFASRLSKLVHHSTYHCEPRDHRLSLITQATKLFMEHRGKNYQYQLGLLSRSEIRCGWCGERAEVLSSILRDGGLAAVTTGFQGHVVSMINIGGENYIADPDYGSSVYKLSPSTNYREVYRKSSLPQMTEVVVPIIEGGAVGPYYSPEYFDTVRSDRRNLYQIADSIAYFMVFVSAGLCLLVFRRFG